VEEYSITLDVVHNATKLGKSKEAVSIFIFDKRNLDKLLMKRPEKDEVIKFMRQEATNLGVLKSPLMVQ
jgi:hypothetical protein